MSNRYSSPVRSPLDSPASSVRPSLDIPNRPNARRVSPSPNPQSGVRRNRIALRDYYNIATTASPTNQTNNRTNAKSPSRTASISSTTSTLTTTTTTLNPTDAPVLPLLDSPGFNPNTYVSSLLSNSSLTNILRAESTLVSEIKTLDGERKALVYDNYSKLIRATETIGMLQKGMDEQTGKGGGKKAKDAVEIVAALAGEIQELGKERKRDRDRRELRRREREKETVRWVLGAPKRWQGLLDVGDEDSGEMIREEWKDIEELFEAWKGAKGVEDVRNACEDILRRLNTKHDDDDEEEEEKEEKKKEDEEYNGHD